MKIICVGRNYSDHILELKNEKPDKPVLFCKPESVLLYSPAEFIIPQIDSEIHYECELVLRIGKDGTNIPGHSGTEWIDGIGLGIDFTARDLQEKLKSKGLPWERAKSFDGSAIVVGLADKWFKLSHNGRAIKRFSSFPGKTFIL